MMDSDFNTKIIQSLQISSLGANLKVMIKL